MCITTSCFAAVVVAHPDDPSRCFESASTVKEFDRGQIPAHADVNHLQELLKQLFGLAS
jgi:hypothetical protein